MDNIHLELNEISPINVVDIDTMLSSFYSDNEDNDLLECMNILTNSMDEYETMRPHPEFRKTPEHKYVVCQKLMEMLEDMTEKYYIIGKMEISDLEFIEKSIMEMQE